ncbi:hypothetical protein COLO4_08987 [Corchorus olitorius]|uniref:Protein kinase domain-containing protein n=1 Tax=Corchorus olitorius TaxID=93759 RepID=A0A1R3KDP6_9ROSI|nr:hypothetical protein COLO4_08987 [Corchorus olitorius]
MLTLITFTVFLFILFSSFSSTSTPYTPNDYILLNCGESSNSTSDDGRIWLGDDDYKYSSSNPKTSSFASIASYQDFSVTRVPYMTARIFHDKFIYSFPVSHGPKFLRLYFYPNDYPGLDITTSFFSVSANNYTLLHNFSAYLVSSIPPPQAFIIKEFIIPVTNKVLNVTFTPSPNSFAFVNGIEVVSMPTNIYMGHNYGSVKLLDTNYLFVLDNTTALETMCRLNVGGRDLSNVDDTGMFRTWNEDGPYSFGVTQIFQPEVTITYTLSTPAYTAPEVVYKTSRSMGPNARINFNYNLTWFFPVDSGFYYFVRLHFCESIPDTITRVNERVFTIFIYNHTAEKAMDVIAASGGNGIPVYKDYVVLVPHSSSSTQDLWIALHPTNEGRPMFWDAILNGIEIFKLSNSDGSLAAPNPEAQPVPKLSMVQQNHSKSSQIKVIVGATVLGSIVFLLLLLSFIFWQRIKQLWYNMKSSNRRKVSPLSEGIRCKHFSLVDILNATNNFDDALIIGRGGFGNVYKGQIQGMQCEVAIKRLNSKSHQGENEFWTEIELLSQLRYINLVSLIGYCNDSHEMILVYDYMANGTLRDHLYNCDNIPFSWKQRLQICIGAARGLNYLHSGAVKRIIHRDVKTTNILLDEKWVAKVSDFGLSKMGPIFTANVPITTMVKGTFGYMDPEYFRRLQLTEKSDVYSFGVVLLEVLCARPAVDIRLEDEQIGLAGWALKCVENETIEQIIDPYLQGKIAPESLRVFAEIARTCLHEMGVERPTMSDVVGMLEFALELQETAETKEAVEVGGDTIQAQTINDVV